MEKMAYTQPEMETLSLDDLETVLASAACARVYCEGGYC